MFRNAKRIGVTTLGLVMLLMAVSSADAQPIPPYPVRLHRIEYRQLNWKERIFASPAQAQVFAQKHANRGFEVVQQTSPGVPIIVRYRLPRWTLYASVSVRDEAHHLARKLQSKGYEVRVIW